MVSRTAAYIASVMSRVNRVNGWFTFTIVAGFAAFAIAADTVGWYLAIGVLSGLAAVISYFNFVVNLATSSDQQQDEALRSAEKAADGISDYSHYCAKVIDVLADRTRAVMKKSEYRAARLYYVGSTLAVLSVFAPVSTFVMYHHATPLDERTIPVIHKMIGNGNSLPNGVTVAVQKDWHILLAGISFGFLFLAAAGAIFSQHRRQIEIYHSVADDVNFLDGVSAAVRMCGRSASQGSNEAKNRVDGVIDRIVAELLHRNPRASRTRPASKTVEAFDERMAASITGEVMDESLVRKLAWQMLR
jgi:hypothetical protein